MSNHYHLVIHLDPVRATQWSDDDVLARWTSLFRGPLLVQQAMAGKALSHAEKGTLQAIIKVYRERLASLSWFMKCLNEPIARQANAEDRCTGHFWEARFHSQALKTEAALLTAMAYVDLNPIRAKMAKTPEASEYTSTRSRICHTPSDIDLEEAFREMIERGELQTFSHSIRPLMPFSEGLMTDSVSKLPMRENEYFKLVDATGRIAQHGKRGVINASLEPILDRLGLSPDEWLVASTEFRKASRKGRLRVETTAQGMQLPLDQAVA
ncbi:MAG: transposase [Pseudomonadota bacterium]